MGFEGGFSMELGIWVLGEGLGAVLESGLPIGARAVCRGLCPTRHPLQPPGFLVGMGGGVL